MARLSAQQTSFEAFSANAHVAPKDMLSPDFKPKTTPSRHNSHQERVAPRGAQPPVTSEWYSCVHTPVPIPKALTIPEAREALEAEWAKLEAKKAWDITKVRPKAEVIREAKATGRTIHFGSLMDLCHLKNSQLGEEFWSYKGRIAFRGDIVKDEEGSFAVFTEQTLLPPTLLLQSSWMLLLECQVVMEKTPTPRAPTPKSL